MVDWDVEAGDVLHRTQQHGNLHCAIVPHGGALVENDLIAVSQHFAFAQR
jgi:hypothetical protein